MINCQHFNWSFRKHGGRQNTAEPSTQSKMSYGIDYIIKRVHIKTWATSFDIMKIFNKNLSCLCAGLIYILV